MTGRQADRYVYGTMNDQGLMRGNKETAKGTRMDAPHPHKNLGKYLHPAKGTKRGSLAAHAAKYVKPRVKK